MSVKGLPNLMCWDGAGTKEAEKLNLNKIEMVMIRK